MARISKDPEERKTEIVDAAEELFISKGYEKTSVSDIVKKVGVAQGLFYYYFKCKDEILNALTEKYLNSIMKKTLKITNNNDSNALEKVHLIIEEMLDILGVRNKSIMSLAHHFHKDENMVMHQKLAKKFVEKLTPIITDVVKEGIKEGLFHTDYPEEATAILLMWAGLLHNNLKLPVEDIEGLKRKVLAIEDFVERILGAKKGSLQFLQYVEWMHHK